VRVTRLASLLLVAVLLGAGAGGPASLLSPPAAAPVEAGSADYRVVGLRRLSTSGGRVAWSPNGQWLFHDRLGEDGFWNVYRTRADGTGSTCITCGRADLPGRNKGSPALHPSGRFLAFVAEKEVHAPAAPEVTVPGAGRYNDVWVLDTVASVTFRLTDVRPDVVSGSLHPHFSHDGTKLFWTDIQGNGGVFGDYQLAVADFTFSPRPVLTNVRFLNPGPQPVWLESQGWSGDDQWLYYSCTPTAGMADEHMDLCVMDAATGSTQRRLTFSNGLNGQAGEWDEHAKASPLGDAISWMTSQPYGTTPGVNYKDWLKTDLWLMNPSGTGRRRVTFFNEPGRPEYRGERVIVADHAWHPTGTSIAMYLQLFESGRHEIWVLDLAR
jgi:hypothetical protein